MTYWIIYFEKYVYIHYQLICAYLQNKICVACVLWIRSIRTRIIRKTRQLGNYSNLPVSDSLEVEEDFLARPDEELGSSFPGEESPPSPEVPTVRPVAPWRRLSFGSRPKFPAALSLRLPSAGVQPIKLAEKLPYVARNQDHHVSHILNERWRLIAIHDHNKLLYLSFKKKFIFYYIPKINRDTASTYQKI